MEKTFAHHTPSDAGVEKIAQLRRGYSNMKQLIELASPASRERSFALTELETSAMWAIKAVVVNDPQSVVQEGTEPNQTSAGKTEIVTDRADPRLHEKKPNGQNAAYLVLSDAERAKGFVRPVRYEYRHGKCGVETVMGLALSETYARDPYFYGSTFCCGCGTHLPVTEFIWSDDGEAVGS